MSTRPILLGRMPVRESSNTDSNPTFNQGPSLAATTVTWEELAFCSKFRAAELARICNVSLRTLERHFRTYFHQNVREWLRLARVSFAFNSIKSGQSIKESAFNAGFKQPSHLSREFKLHFGFPPSFMVMKASESLQRISTSPSHETNCPFCAQSRL